MSVLTVVNTRGTPYVIDDDGHILAGYERGDVDDSNDRVARALTSGVFLKVETGGAGTSNRSTATPDPAPTAADSEAS
jgi:hypothetical protein